jgi:hypothetical protein
MYRIALFPDSWMEKVWKYEQQHLYPMCHMLHVCHVVRFMIESGTFKSDSKWASGTGPFGANSVVSTAFRNQVFACRRGKKVSIYDVATVLYKGHVNGQTTYSFKDFEENRDCRFDYMSLMEYKQLNARAHKNMQERDGGGEFDPDQLDVFDLNMKSFPGVGIVDNVQQQVHGFFSFGHEERAPSINENLDKRQMHDVVDDVMRDVDSDGNGNDRYGDDETENE